MIGDWINKAAHEFLLSLLDRCQHSKRGECVCDPCAEASLVRFAEMVRIQALREAASKVHCLRPAESEPMGANRYERDIAYPHVLRQFVKDRDAVTDLIPADWNKRLDWRQP